MIFFYSVIFLLISYIILAKLSLQYNILLNYSGDNHQKYTSSYRIPLIGGSIFFSFLLIFIDIDYLIKLFLFFIYILGIFSDLKLLESPIKRLLFQFLIIIFFLYTIDLHIELTRFSILDYLLKNFFFSLFFTTFCLLIVVNGTNFIDGNNANVLGYYLIISVILLLLNINGYQSISINNNFLLIKVIFILLVFNLINKIYLGDSGAFVLGAFFGLILIKFYLSNMSIVSSFFIVLTLWYPAFENLFSILRKFYFSKSPAIADSNHLHQLLYFFLLKKLKWNILSTNNSVGLLINTYNFIILFVGFKNLNHTKFLIFIIFLNIFAYILIYLVLFKFKKNISQQIN